MSKFFVRIKQTLYNECLDVIFLEGDEKVNIKANGVLSFQVFRKHFKFEKKIHSLLILFGKDQ